MNNTLLNFANAYKHGLDINILYAKYCEKDDDWHSTVHLHPFTELFYVVKGKGKFISEDKEFIIEEDDLLIINSNIKHTEDSLNDEDFAYVVIGIDGISILRENSLAIGDSEKDSNFDNFIDSYLFMRNFKDHRDILRRLINSIDDEMNKKEDYYKEFANSYLNLLVLNIVRLSNSNLLVRPDKKGNKQLEFIKNYMDQHYSRDLSLDDLANMAYINKFYLVHEFKKQYDMTPIDYLLRKRVDTSRELLANTDYSMEEIASIVGFNSQSYFNQVFKKKIGSTPSAYRKMNRPKK